RAESSGTSWTAGGRAERAQRLSARHLDPKSQEAPRVAWAWDERSPSTHRTHLGILSTAAGDEPEQPPVLGLLQPQPQLRGAFPVPAARRWGRAALLLRLRRPQVLLQRAGQLLPLQAQLHVEPQYWCSGWIGNRCPCLTCLCHQCLCPLLLISVHKTSKIRQWP
ncbi:RIKEN cDNA A930021C24, partial [Mus musculus]